MLPDVSFGKSKRLLKAKEFQAVFDQVDWKVSSKYILCLSKNNGLSHPRLGLVIAKKNIKLAVQRNRIKRIVRDSFRLHQQQLPNVDMVILARRGLDEHDNAALQSEVNHLWKRLIKKSNQ